MSDVSFGQRTTPGSHDWIVETIECRQTAFGGMQYWGLACGAEGNIKYSFIGGYSQGPQKELIGLNPMETQPANISLARHKSDLIIAIILNLILIFMFILTFIISINKIVIRDFQ